MEAVSYTARKSSFSISREHPVCTGFPTGTAELAFSTGRADRYEKRSLVPVGNTNRY